MKVTIIHTCSGMRTPCAVCGFRFRPDMVVGHIEHDREAWLCDDCIPDQAMLTKERDAAYMQAYDLSPEELEELKARRSEEQTGCPF